MEIVFAKSSSVSTVPVDRVYERSKRIGGNAKPRLRLMVALEIFLIGLLMFAIANKSFRHPFYPVLTLESRGVEGNDGEIGKGNGVDMEETAKGEDALTHLTKFPEKIVEEVKLVPSEEDAMVVKPNATVTDLSLSKYHGLEMSELIALGRKANVKFHVVVLTMNRPTALLRLLESIRAADTDGDTVDLTIWIDLLRKEKIHDEETVKVAESFAWTAGKKTVHKREANMGLIKNWLTCWSPNPEDAKERPIILEDDLEVSPLYYLWLKAAVAKYDGIEDVSSYTLQRITLIPTTGQTKGLMNMNEGAYLYRLLGTWGFSPKPEVWGEFQQWYEERAGNSSFKPHVDGLKINDWYHGREWSNWFIRFTAERNTYVVHHHVDDQRVTLVGNWREPGEHYGKGPAKGLDFPVLQKDHGVKFRFPEPSQLVRLDWDGKPSLEHHSKFLRNHKESFDKMLQYAKLEQGGELAISLVNYNFLPFTRSFMCNVDLFKIRPKGLAWITNDKKALKELEKDKSYGTFYIGFEGGEADRGTTFGTAGYWELMISRAQLVLELLLNNVTVLLFDSDQVWLKDPLVYVAEVIKDAEVDVVGVLTSQNEVGGNFVYLRPTSRVKEMYSALVNMFEADYEKKNIRQLGIKADQTIQNDQTLLSSLVHRNEKWKAKFQCVFRSLDSDIFPDGRWYKGAYKTNPRTYDPVLINNNFVTGNEEKIKRAVQYGHWFYNDTKKRCEKPEMTKYYAADGKYRHVPLRYPWEPPTNETTVATH